MTHLTKLQPVLRGGSVDLIPLKKEHFPELIKLSKDKRIWEFYVLDGTDEKRFLETLHGAFTESEKGNQFSFVIYHKAGKKIIGSTRFMDIQPAHKKLEIGWTWLHPDFWGTEINYECKLLLLTFCFENLKTLRVQLKTDANNLRSRKAIEKIGGKFEGILRNDMLRDNGTIRNSAYYSILDTEWSALKPKLEMMCENRRDTPSPG